MKLGLIGYGAIGKHVEAAGLENIDLVSVLVRRPRQEGVLTRGVQGVNVRQKHRLRLEANRDAGGLHHRDVVGAVADGGGLDDLDAELSALAE